MFKKSFVIMGCIIGPLAVTQIAPAMSCVDVVGGATPESSLKEQVAGIEEFLATLDDLFAYDARERPGFIEDWSNYLQLTKDHLILLFTPEISTPRQRRLDDTNKVFSKGLMERIILAVDCIQGRPCETLRGQPTTVDAQLREALIMAHLWKQSFSHGLHNSLPAKPSLQHALAQMFEYAVNVPNAIESEILVHRALNAVVYAKLYALFYPDMWRSTSLVVSNPERLISSLKKLSLDAGIMHLHVTTYIDRMVVNVSTSRLLAIGANP